MNTATLTDLSHDLLIEAVREAAHPLRGAADDYDPLLELIGDARFVLIGEASHGTHEFYRERAQITKRLIREKGFNAVAVEADWPDAYRVNRYVRGRGDDAEAIDALAGFQRFPTWMWRNADVLDFVGWLRDHNDSVRPGTPKVGFYGLDLYSLHASMAAVIAYLDKVDPEAAERARHRYACFDLYGDDPQAYGFAAGAPTGPDLRERGDHPACRPPSPRGRICDARRPDRGGRLLLYRAECAAGARCRAVLPDDVPRRSVLLEPARPAHGRDARCAGRLLRPQWPRREGGRLGTQLAPRRCPGDADGRARRVERRPARTRQYGRDAVLVGCTTYDGTVTAASNWDAPAERKRVRPALPGSYEALFHDAGLERFLLTLARRPSAGPAINRGWSAPSA